MMNAWHGRTLLGTWKFTSLPGAVSATARSTISMLDFAERPMVPGSMAVGYSDHMRSGLLCRRLLVKKHASRDPRMPKRGYMARPAAKASMPPGVTESNSAAVLVSPDIVGGCEHNSRNVS